MEDKMHRNEAFSSMSFDYCIQLQPPFKQDLQHFHHPGKFPCAFFQ